jgi:hypothetical protein
VVSPPWFDLLWSKRGATTGTRAAWGGRVKLAVLAGVFAASCSRGGQSAPAQIQQRLGAGSSCAAGLPKAQVTVEESDGELSIRFITGDNDVEELRRRVAAMAEQHNHLHSQSAAAWRQEQTRVAVPSASIAEVEEIEGGARLILRRPQPSP